MRKFEHDRKPIHPGKVVTVKRQSLDYYNIMFSVKSHDHKNKYEKVKSCCFQATLICANISIFSGLAFIIRFF